jgi:hypothetical protein
MSMPQVSGIRAGRACASRNWSRPAGLLAAATTVAAATYATWVALTWLRYGRPERPSQPEESDSLLDRFMPEFEVAERHHIEVAAPAQVTLDAAAETDLARSPIVRGIFRGRELLMRSHPPDRQPPAGLLAQAKALGWAELSHVPGREIVLGAATRPWEANPVFQPVPPEEFANFMEPGFAKIVWTLRADPIGPSTSMFRTETRVSTTDAASRAKFRRYWAFLLPGIRMIRMAMLLPVKREAEARVRPARLATAV